jgi:hypothetical protein
MYQNRAVFFEHRDALARLESGAGSSTIVNPTVSYYEDALPLRKRVSDERSSLINTRVE